MALRLTFHDNPPAWVWLVRGLARLFGLWLPQRFAATTQKLHRPAFSDLWLWEYMDVVLSERIKEPCDLEGARYACLLEHFLDASEVKGLHDNAWPDPYVFAVLPKFGAFETLAAVQKVFPPLPLPGGDPKAGSDEEFVLRLFNGMGPAFALRQLGEQGRSAAQWQLRCTFAGLDRDSASPYVLPDCVIQLRADRPLAEQPPTLVGLSLSYDEGRNWQHHTPADDPWLWTNAKRVVRSALLLTYEIEEHIGCGHVLAEAGLVALRAAPRGSRRLFDLLLPHLRDADGINDFGNPLIFAETGILTRASGLAPEGVLLQIARNWRKLSPFHFQAPEALGPWHTYGIVAERVWRAVQGHVDAELGTLGATNWWQRTLRTVAAFAIYHATFYHTWCNDQQRRDGGELAVATFGLCKRLPPTAPLSEDGQQAWERDAEPLVRDALYQLFLGRALTVARVGYVVPSAGKIARECDDQRANLEDAMLFRFGGHLRTALEGQDIFHPKDLRARVNT